MRARRGEPSLTVVLQGGDCLQLLDDGGEGVGDDGDHDGEGEQEDADGGQNELDTQFTVSLPCPAAPTLISRQVTPLSSSQLVALLHPDSTDRPSCTQHSLPHE